MNGSNPEHRFKTLRLTVPNPKSMKMVNSNKCTEASIKTEIVFVGGVPWKFYAHLDEKRGKAKKAHRCPHQPPPVQCLSLYLECCWEIQTTWSIPIIATPRVVNQGNQYGYKKDVVKKTVSSGNRSVAFKYFIEWSDVFRGTFIRRDELKLDLKLFVVKVKTTAQRIHNFYVVSPEARDNVEIVVRNRMFNVNPRILSYHSPWFKKRCFAVKKQYIGFENQLTELDPTDFHSFLQVLYGHARVLTWENVERVLQLGIRFQAKIVIRWCEQFVIRSKLMCRKEKLALAHAYKLKYLQKLIFNSVDSEEEIDRHYAFLNFLPLHERVPILNQMECQLLKKNQMKAKEDGGRISLKAALSLGDRKRSDVTRIKDDIPFRLGVKLRLPQKYDLKTGNTKNPGGKRILRVCTECFWTATSDWYCIATVKYSVICISHLKFSCKVQEFTITKTFFHAQPRFYHDFKVFPDDIIFEIYADITVQKFSEGVFKKRRKHITFSKSLLSNATVQVGAMKFHVIKEIVANESEFFRALFFGAFKERHETSFRFDYIDSHDFEELLHMIYQPLRPVTKDSVQALLPLADYFLVTSVKERCDWYVLNTHQLDFYEKAHLATIYNLESTARSIRERELNVKLAGTN